MLEMAHIRNCSLIEVRRVELHLGPVEEPGSNNATFDKTIW